LCSKAAHALYKRDTTACVLAGNSHKTKNVGVAHWDQARSLQVKNFGRDRDPDALADHQVKERGKVIENVPRSPLAFGSEEYVDPPADSAQRGKCPSLEEASPTRVAGPSPHRPVDQRHVIPADQIRMAGTACVVFDAERQLEKLEQGTEWVVDHDVGPR